MRENNRYKTTSFLTEALSLWTNPAEEIVTSSSLPAELTKLVYPQVDESKKEEISVLLMSSSQLTNELESFLGPIPGICDLPTCAFSELSEPQQKFISATFIRLSIAILSKLNTIEDFQQIDFAIQCLAYLHLTEFEKLSSNVGILIISKIGESNCKMVYTQAIQNFAETANFSDSILNNFPYFPIFLSQLFKSLDVSGQNERANKIIQLVKHLKESLPEGKIESLSDISSSLMDLTLKQMDNEELINTSTEIFDLMTELSIRASLPDNAVKHVIHLMRCQRNQINDIVKKDILICVANNHIDNINEKFIIKNPTILTLILNFLQRDDYLADFIFQISELCDYSIENIFACHEGKFDIALIDLINKNKMDFDFVSKPAIGPMMSLIITIANVVSSSTVVQNFIGLMCPVQGAFLSKMHSGFISSIADLIDRCAKSPVTYFQSSELSVDINGINQSVFTSPSFNVSLWAFIPNSIPADHESVLFSLQDQQGLGYTGYIKNQEVMVRIKYQRSEATANLGLKVFTDTWIPLSFVFSRNDRALLVSIAIKGLLGTPQECPVFNFNRNSQIKLTFGGAEPCVNPVRIGPCHISHDISEAGIQKIASDGPRKENVNAIASLTMKSDMDGNLVPSLTKSFPIISVSMNGTAHAYYHFLDVLHAFCGVQMILPLYKWLDYMYVDDEELPSFAVPITNLIVMLLLSSEASQSEFVRNDGFRMLARMLINARPRHLNYMLYQKLIGLYEGLTVKEARNAILKNIILNLEIWVHAEFEQQKRIIRQWGRHIYDHFYEEAIEARSFIELLSMLRIFYWYTPVETEIVFCDPKSDHPRPAFTLEQMTDLRGIIINALHTISLKEFSSQDFCFLLGNCVTLQDTHQMADLLKLMKLIAVSEEMPLKNVEGEWELFNTLHHIINRDDSDVVLNVIDVFATLHLVRYMDYPKEHIHANILMNLVPPVFFNMETFKFIITFVDRFPEFLSLLFYMIIKIDNQEVYPLVMRNLTPKSEYATKKQWVLWPIICALSSPSSFMYFIMKFLALSSLENWSFTFGAIDVIARALGVNGDAAKTTYLNELCKHLLGIPLLKHEKQNEFFDLVNFHVFFRRATNDEPVTPYMHQIFTDSPFKDVVNAVEAIPNMYRGVIDKNMIYKRLEEIKDEDYKVYFGLRFDSSGTWLDADLALNVVKQMRRVSVKSFHNASTLLAAFALQDRSELAYEQIGALLQLKIADKDFLSVIQHHDKRYTGIQEPTQAFELFINDAAAYNENVIGSFKGISEKFIKFHDKCLSTMERIFERDNDNLFSSTNRLIKYENVRFTGEKSVSTKEISHLWRRVSSSGAPFYNEALAIHFLKKEQFRLSSKLLNGVPSILTVDKNAEELKLKEAKNCDEEYRKFSENYKNILYEKHLRASPQDVMKNIIPVEINEYSLVEIPSYLIEFDNRRESLITLRNDHFTLSLQNHAVVRFDHNNVKRVMLRPIQHVPVGIEVYTTDNRSYLIELVNYNAYNVLNFIKLLPGFVDIEVMTIEPEKYVKHMHLTEKWVSRQISTFEYLLRLNDIAGRSFHTPSFYPIMPAIIDRDLSKPMPQPSNLRSITRILGHLAPFSNLAASINDGYADIEAIKDISKTTCELTPEFFSAPCVIQDLNLEAKDAHDFILKHRALLESDKVTADLPAWIDFTFGFAQSKEMLNENSWTSETLTNVDKRIDMECRMIFEGSNPCCLFQEPHPKQNEKKTENRFDGLSVGSRLNVMALKALVVDQHINGVSLSMTAAASDDLCHRIVLAEIQGELRCLIKEFKPTEPNSTAFAAFGKSFLSGNADGTIMVSNEDTSTSFQGHTGPILFAAADSMHFITCGKDATTKVWGTSPPYKLMLSIPAFKGSITSCALSSEYHCAAVGTSDGTVAILSLTSGTVNRTVSTHGVATQLLLTPSWGVLVAFSPTVAGGVITVSSTTHEFEVAEFTDLHITSWCVADRGDGVDLVVCSSADGQIAVFDAFNPGEIRIIKTIDEPIKGLFYSKSAACAVALVESGTFLFISV